MTVDPFAPISGGEHSKQGTRNWRCVVPVPETAPKAPSSHSKLGRPSKVWRYRDPQGNLLGFVCRFEEGNGAKSFRPLTLIEEPGVLRWRWQAWPDNRPLYGLDKLAANPTATVLVTEGEKAADAAQELLPDLVTMTAPGGSNGVGKVDFSPLKGRIVIVWPDADDPGQKFAKAFCARATSSGAASAVILSTPKEVSQGWDAADALEAGWTSKQTAEFVRQAQETETAEPTAPKKTTARKSQSGPKKNKRGSILDAAKDAELWHSPQKQAFATIFVNGHAEHWPLESKSFKRWFSARIHELFVHIPSGPSISDALRILEVKALEDGPCFQPFIRTGFDGKACWLDLADDAWRAVRITRHGWEVIDRPPVKFLRTETMEPLPDPEKAVMIEELRSFVNTSDDDYKLIVAWLVASLFGKTRTYPVLALGGEQGSGKSTMARLLRSLTDPSHVSALATPRDERDFIVMALNAHVLSFDNVSKVEPWFSDSICRLATGAGFITRKLHSDGDPFWFHGSKPVLLNGIPSLTERADLAERSLTVRLQRIDETSRQSEDAFWRAWENIRPGILGALLDAVSSALRNWDKTDLKQKPRMADFAHMMTAAEPGLGWEPGAFMEAYTANRQATTEAVFESDPVAVAILKFIQEEHPTNGWEGTATELLGHLNRIVSEDLRRSRFWPAKPNALGNAVDRAAPLLRHRGIQTTKRSTGAKRLIFLCHETK
ncbi:ATP-binding protein [Labrenzia sp. PHM005]|uniref:ATP-binding protein n=1 Tax=Labrenzia sp. PHM005 TaxID=2590016 RepID=UPI00114030F6|nr:ATP-binding protein [Labrenzia sp. PHM005]QDG79374.1 ATP-binding protein [Labrenzia sp. PHM005]